MLYLYKKIKLKYVFHKIQKNNNLIFNGKVKLIGTPIIRSQDGGKIIIDENVTLNSDNRGTYHINMHSPIKLFAEGKNAIIRIGANSRIHGTCIHAMEKIIIGKNCLIAANCQIIDSNGHDLSFDNPAGRITTKGNVRPVIIEDNVWICANSFILPGVHIGEGSVITANSVVTEDVPARALAGGNPARVLNEK